MPALFGPSGVVGGAERYAPVHAVAHWDDAQRKRSGNYDRKFEGAVTLAAPPAVIPIDRGRQLFVDDFLNLPVFEIVAPTFTPGVTIWGLG